MATDPTPSLADAIGNLSNVIQRDGIFETLKDFAAALLAEARKDQPAARKCSECNGSGMVEPFDVLGMGSPCQACRPIDAKTMYAIKNMDKPAAPSPEPAPLCEEAREWRERAESASFSSEFGAYRAVLDEAAAAWSAEKRSRMNWHEDAVRSDQQAEQARAERDAAVRERDDCKVANRVLREEVDNLRARLAAAEREKHAWAASVLREVREDLWQALLEREEAAAKAKGEVGNA